VTEAAAVVTPFCRSGERRRAPLGGRVLEIEPWLSGVLRRGVILVWRSEGARDSLERFIQYGTALGGQGVCRARRRE
jgi:hypothetical protein